jgi:uncharacterized protein (TIGR01777 family)
MRVLLSGASGLIGSALARRLAASSEVVRLVRRDPLSAAKEIRWDPAAGRIEPKQLEGFDAVVHLAGENIGAGRWTAAKKASIRASRVEGTSLLAKTLAGLNQPPKVLVSASAVGYYGDRGEEKLDESSGPGTGFLAEVCRAWEGAAMTAAEAGRSRGARAIRRGALAGRRRLGSTAAAFPFRPRRTAGQRPPVHELDRAGGRGRERSRLRSKTIRSAARSTSPVPSQ